MKLGGSGKDDESFVKQLESEGVKVASVGAPVKAAGGLNKVCHMCILQGGFFNWSALKMTKCQTLRKF